MLWFRLVGLLRVRGELAHECLQRMARHLTQFCDGRGRLLDLPELLAAYGRRHGVSTRTAWNDFRRMVEARIVRQTAAAAPGRQARYVLALDVAGLPEDLPRDLAREVRAWVDDPQTAARTRYTRAERHAALAECETVRVGSAVREPRETAHGAGRLHTSPYTREREPPSPHDDRPERATGPRRRPSWEPGPADLGPALYLVKAVRAIWKNSTTKRAVPSVDDLADVVRLVSLLLRYMPPGEAQELLTARTDSVRDLGGVARWRIGRALRASRRRYAGPVDDDGTLWDRWHAERRARLRAQALRGAELRAQAEHERARMRAERERAEALRVVEARDARRRAEQHAAAQRSTALRTRLAGILRRREPRSASKGTEPKAGQQDNDAEHVQPS